MPILSETVPSNVSRVLKRVPVMLVMVVVCLELGSCGGGHLLTAGAEEMAKLVSRFEAKSRVL